MNMPWSIGANAPHLAVDDGGSTDSESSYQGWSDATGWRDSPNSTNPRVSLSSSEELPPHHPPSASDASHSSPTSTSRGVSFSSSQPSGSAISHRRQTLTRPPLQAAGSNISLDTLTPTASRSGAAVLNMDPAPSPAPASMPYPPHPPPSYASDGNYGAYPRSRRKSVTVVSPQLPGESDEDPSAAAYHPNANGHTKTGSKSKKRNRTGSFTYLPFHRRRRMSNPNSPASYLLNLLPRRMPSRRLLLALVVLLATLVWIIQTFKRYYEIQVEFSIFSRRWVRHEVDNIQPLRGCFDPQNVSPLYNISLHRTPSRQLLAPGIAMRRGMSCYDFSSTIQTLPDTELEPLLYHTYWRSDLLTFGDRQSAALTAFLATQPLSHSKLILWTNGADIVASNPHMLPFLEKWGEYIEIRQVDMTTLTKGTELDGRLSNVGGGLFDERAWVDGDAVRLLVLWHFGGVWMDMDQILTRDLHPLTDSEFVTQWDCYDKPYFTLNGALLHFRQHSPYLCEAFHIMASSPFPKPNTFTWGAHLYSKLHRRLLASHIQPFTVLPWCFADPRNCRADIAFPDPFDSDPEYWAGRRWDGKGEVGRSGREVLEEKVGWVWSVHLHNQWKKGFPKGGWVERLIEGYRGRVDEIERWAREEAGLGKGGDKRVHVKRSQGISPREAIVEERAFVEEPREGGIDEEDVQTGNEKKSVQ